MSFSLKITSRFDKELKRLTKKYPSLKTEYVNFVSLLVEEPFQGEPIGKGFYKIRLGILSKGKGKRSGARIITYIAIVDEKVYLATIYDKSEKENITQKELDAFLTELQL